MVNDMAIVTLILKRCLRVLQEFLAIRSSDLIV